jgi:hypothetical protein
MAVFCIYCGEELADAGREFAHAVESMLPSWNSSVERLRAKAAARTGEARGEAEAAVGALRKRQNDIAQSLAVDALRALEG